jgi:mannose-1-phosphate guanylyltransferase
MGTRAMLEKPNAWALVLAAGEGSRLRLLTTPPSGTTVPKQFCSPYSGPSLLDEALCRAHFVAAESR